MGVPVLRTTCLTVATVPINRYYRKDYGRARLAYANALRTMEERGPDVPLLLFAFAVFCLVTRV